VDLTGRGNLSAGKFITRQAWTNIDNQSSVLMVPVQDQNAAEEGLVLRLLVETDTISRRHTRVGYIQRESSHEGALGNV